MFLWLPSQNCGLPDILHMQIPAVLVSSATNTVGAKLVPLWDPSHHGWLAEAPQEHHAYFSPAFKSTLTGIFPATIAFSILLV